jgi:uncharacterized protein with HEPN domain
MRNKSEDNKSRFEQILKSLNEIEKYTLDQSEESFCNNNLLHDAVLLQFIVIGESINHIEAEILEKFEYPWYKVRSFRNLIAHEYFNIKLEAVWQIIVNNLPELNNLIEHILKNKF